MPTILRVGRGLPDLCLRPNPHITRMHGSEIENIETAIVAPAPYDIIIERIWLRIATFTATYTMPCTERNRPTAEVTTGPAIAPRILPVAVNIVRHAIIYRYMI